MSHVSNKVWNADYNWRNITVCRQWTLRRLKCPTMQCSTYENNIADNGGQCPKQICCMCQENFNKCKWNCRPWRRRLSGSEVTHPAVRPKRYLPPFIRTEVVTRQHAGGAVHLTKQINFVVRAASLLEGQPPLCPATCKVHGWKEEEHSFW